MSNRFFSDGDKPVAFISVSDRNRARQFYAEKLQLPILYEDEFALVMDLGITSLRISELKTFRPQQFTVLGWEVADIVASAEKLKTLNIEARRFNGMEQDELGLWCSPGTFARILWFEDPDGNLLSLTERLA